MSQYDTFEWQQFPERRARFSGGIRGWDERGYDTFAVEIDGEVVYGDSARAFLPNHHDFNAQVVSFGYGMRETSASSTMAVRGDMRRARSPQRICNACNPWLCNCSEPLRTLRNDL